MRDGTDRGSNSSEGDGSVPTNAAPSPATAAPTADEPVRVSLFDAVGGSTFFWNVVDHFYDAVERDPVLKPLYPEDLTDARRHTALFLVQYWGGPATYSEERGHPRLRMRHLPFAIGPAERDAWLALMMAAIDATLADAPADSLLGHPTEGPMIMASARSMFADYFEQASSAMINQS
jgi:hemoglobin